MGKLAQRRANLPTAQSRSASNSDELLVFALASLLQLCLSESCFSQSNEMERQPLPAKGEVLSASLMNTDMGNSYENQ
jgi:hypothetical protein